MLSYFCIWGFFAYASWFVADVKGWKYSKDDIMGINIDWVFWSLWYGPWTFLVVCALPPRWSIPKKDFEETQKELIASINAQRFESSGFILDLFDGIIFVIKEFFSKIVISIFMLAFPLLQISIILKYGFNWSFFDFLVNQLKT